MTSVAPIRLNWGTYSRRKKIQFILLNFDKTLKVNFTKIFIPKALRGLFMKVYLPTK